ncbi:hypothetical protein [Ectobacillus funiculus]|uniref:hypothetical protein n=1 Tax=Ectobacillus funiculus TaxID=137993 RepID=UPI00196A8491|nr:hypothetical protein [Ectobacillus funiculus]
MPFEFDQRKLGESALSKGIEVLTEIGRENKTQTEFVRKYSVLISYLCGIYLVIL